METTRLTPHEERLLVLVSEGKKNSEIAEVLRKTCTSVEWSIQNLRNKLGCSNRAQLVSFAFRNNLINV